MATQQQLTDNNTKLKAIEMSGNKSKQSYNICNSSTARACHTPYQSLGGLVM